MGQIGAIIAAPAQLSLLYAERLLKDVPADKFARLADGARGPIQSNHPAFILGHLALYPAKVLTYLGQSPGASAAPDAYVALFKDGVACQDDPAGKIYPPMADVTRRYFDGYRAAAAAVANADDSVLVAPNPNEGRSRDLFPLVGGMLAFYLSGHVQVHLGQFSAWRRAMGMSAA